MNNYGRKLLYITCCWLGLYASVVLANSQFQYQRVEAQALTQQSYVRGQVHYLNQVKLAFRSSGYVETLSVEVGDEVGKGQVLAQLDVDEIRYQAKAVKHQLTLANKEKRRVKALLAKKLASKSLLDSANANQAQLQEQLKQLQYLLSKGQLQAPIAGVITKRQIQIGDFVNTGQTLLTLAPKHNNTIASFYLTEQEVTKVDKGQQLQLVRLLDAYPLTGQVHRIAQLPDSAGRYRVDIALTQAVRVGTDVNLVLETGVQMVFAVSHHTPIKVENNRAYVLVKNQGNTEQRSFAIVDLDDDYLYIKAQEEQLELVSNGWVAR